MEPSVGMNIPIIIKYPLWKMTAQNSKLEMYCQDCTIRDTTCKDKKAILKRPHRSQLRIENPHDRPKGCVQWTERTKAEVLDIYTLWQKQRGFPLSDKAESG